MSLYLHMKTTGVVDLGEDDVDFSRAYHTILEIDERHLDSYSDRLTKLHTKAERAETRFEIWNGHDEMFVSFATVQSYSKAPKIYLTTPVHTSVIPIGMATPASVIHSTIRKVLRSANDILSGKIPSPIAKISMKEE